MDRRSMMDILQIGDIDAGNKMLFSKKMEANSDHLTLVIGCGGIGANVIKQAVKKFEPGFGKCVKFLLADADSCETESAIGEPGCKAVQAINLSMPGADARFSYDHRDDFYRTFMPKDFSAETMDHHGSGCVRMNGKAKFYDCMMESGKYNDMEFRYKIAGMLDEECRHGKQVDIMVLAGLSGGTGSGIFEEAAVHARYACQEAGADNVRVFGYLFLPDTMEKLAGGNPAVMSCMYANGYAALKELESYMSIPFNRNRKEKFAAHGAEVSTDSARMLFDYPVLLSGSYSKVTSMMADLIVLFAANHLWIQNMLFGNTGNARIIYLQDLAHWRTGLLESGFFPEDSHRYSSVGYACATLPREIVTANIVGSVCTKLYQDFDAPNSSDEPYFCTNSHRMSRLEMERHIRRLFGLQGEVTVRSLWERKIKPVLERASRLPDNLVEISRRDINCGMTETYRKAFREGTCIEQGKREMENALEEIFSHFMEASRGVILENGPRALEYLYQGAGMYCEKGYIQFYHDVSIEDILEYARKELVKIISRNVPEPSCNIPSGALELITSRGLDAWKGNFHDWVKHQVKQGIVGWLLQPDGVWERKIAGPMKRYIHLCGCFADRLEMLKNFYACEGRSLDSSDYYEMVSASQNENGVSLVNRESYVWIKKTARQHINRVDMTRVRQELVDSFIREPSVWDSDRIGETRREFDRIMAVCCGLNGNGGLLTTTQYFEHLLMDIPQDDVHTVIRQYVGELTGRLLERSKPSIKKRIGSFSAVSVVILLPQSMKGLPYGDFVANTFRAELQNRGISCREVIPFGGTEIVCCQASVANALCDLEDIGLWEKNYLKAGAYSRSGRHLINGEPGYAGSFCEQTKQETENEKAKREGRPVTDLHLTPEEEIIFGTGLRLENYPPLALHDLEYNDSERRFRETVFEPIVDYALKEQIIERIPGRNPNSHIYVVNLIPEAWTNLDVSAYGTVDRDGEREKGFPLFLYLQKQNPCVMTDFRKVIRLEDSGYLDAEYDFDGALQHGDGRAQEEIDRISLTYMKRKLRKNTALFVELRETLCRYYEIAKQLEKS